MKKALITGITGQDGSLLAELLLSKGYSVIGTGNPKNRHIVDSNLERISGLIKIFYIDITDTAEVSRLIINEEPHEIYNLAAISNSMVAKQNPTETALINGLSVVTMLSTIKNHCPSTRFFQASSSEIFGSMPVESPQNEDTTCKPDNPYSIAKYFAQQMVRYFREQENIFACSGILYNHESMRRKSGFLTQKIMKGIIAIKAGKESHITLGNLNSIRDWGSAEDYVVAIHLMLQADKPDDYIIATGVPHTVREFAEKAFRGVGIDIEWVHSGMNEVGLDIKTGIVRVRVSQEFFRQRENENVVGNPDKIFREIGWKATTSLDAMIEDMLNKVTNN